MSHSIVLVGCGNMGYAMLSGWLRQDPGLRVDVVEPFAEFRQRAVAAGAGGAASLAELPAGLSPDLVVLAVKPQMVAGVLADCAELARAGASFVSVAAGVTIPAMARQLPAATPIIRCMPNTPAAIGAGMMALCAGPGVGEDARALTERLFKASGAVTWIADESLMDAVTAISGSGPAYVFHFIETLTRAGVALGLPAATALLLAKQTVAGAGQMALELETPPSILREQVTSPGGTTAAALAVLMADDRLAKLVCEATTAARNRGRELGRDT